MASVSRTAQFGKVHKVLRRYYKPVAAEPSRPVLEHLVFACCLEDAQYEPAEEVFAALSHSFFDWNEVRVTSLAELSEVLGGLPDPRTAASRVKRLLQSIFEATYSFDLEDRRKKNLGPTIKWLEKLDGATGFTVAYVVQAALGGHAIPIDTGTMRVLRLLELVTDKDVPSGVVPGLERAVSKSKGIEFGSLLHQLGADFTANPYAPTVREILLQINPDIEDRLPKRRGEKPAKPASAESPAQSKPPSAAPPQVESAKPRKKQAEPAEGRPVDPAAAPQLPAAAKSKPPAEKTVPPAEKTVPPAEEKPAPTEEPAPEARPKKKSPTVGLAKRKPR